MSRLAHEYPDQPELWMADHHQDTTPWVRLGSPPRSVATDINEPKPVNFVLREIMHEQAALRGSTLCEFCQLRVATHQLVTSSGDSLGELIIECCDACDDLDPSDLPVELA